jgi:hypothetical protein
VTLKLSTIFTDFPTSAVGCIPTAYFLHPADFTDLTTTAQKTLQPSQQVQPVAVSVPYQTIYGRQKRQLNPAKRTCIRNKPYSTCSQCQLNRKETGHLRFLGFKYFPETEKVLFDVWKSQILSKRNWHF